MEADPRGGRRAEPVRLLFNYLSEDNRIWQDATLRRTYSFLPTFPAPADDGHLRVAL